jgi:hypothetical protein
MLLRTGLPFLLSISVSSSLTSLTVPEGCPFPQFHLLQFNGIVKSTSQIWRNKVNDKHQHRSLIRLLCNTPCRCYDQTPPLPKCSLINLRDFIAFLDLIRHVSFVSEVVVCEVAVAVGRWWMNARGKPKLSTPKNDSIPVRSSMIWIADRRH